MSPTTLKRLGNALYGPQFQTSLAKALGVTREAVIGWMRGAYAPSPDRAIRAKELIGERMAELRSLKREL